MDDFNLFDFNSETWLKVRMTVDGRVFTPQCIYQNDLNRKKDPRIINERKLHKMCAVWDMNFYSKLEDCENIVIQDRLIWRQERNDLSYREGFYIFGGMDERNVF